MNLELFKIVCDHFNYVDKWLNQADPTKRVEIIEKCSTFNLIVVDQYLEEGLFPARGRYSVVYQPTVYSTTYLFNGLPSQAKAESMMNYLKDLEVLFL